MDKTKFVAVPVDLMNDILSYLTEQRFKEVHSLVNRLSLECTSIDSFEESEESEES
jgi:hypothetical protein